MTSTDTQQNSLNQKEKIALRERLDGAGWALFFIMIGVLLFLPEGTVPEDTWLLGMGSIILTVNAVKYLYGIRPDWFFVVIGVLALSAGVDNYLGFELPLLAFLLIATGGFILLKPKLWDDKDENWDWCWNSDKSDLKKPEKTRQTT